MSGSRDLTYFRQVTVGTSTLDMPSSRRSRSSRHIERKRSPQTLFHVFTIVVILGIVFLEDAAREFTKDSNTFQPSYELTNASFTNSETSIGLSSSSNEENALRGKPIRHDPISETAGKGLETSVFKPKDEMKQDLTKNRVQVVEGKKKEPNEDMNEEETYVTGQGINGVVREAPTSWSTDQTTTTKSYPPNREGRPSHVKEKNGWINVDEFRRRAEERALYDGLIKRNAIIAGSKTDSNDNVTSVDLFSAIETTASSESTKKWGKGDDDEDNQVFRGVLHTKENAELFKLDNLTRLSFMVYRLVKAQNATSMLDIPCSKSILWMSDVLYRLEFEIPSFHYRCIAPNDEYLMDAILRYKDLTNAVVLKDANFWASKLPKTDLAISWYGVGYLPPRQSWQLLKGIRKANIKYVIVPHHPDVHSNPGSETKTGRVNLRRSPYRFDEATRVVNNISATFPKKQLLLYELDKLRNGIL